MNFLRTIPKDKLQKLVLVAIVALTVVGGVLQFYVLKGLRELNEARAEVASLEVRIREAETTARKVVQTEQSRERIQAFAQAQLATMVSGDPFAWAVRELSQVAEQCLVHVVSWHPGAKGLHAQKPAYATYLMRLDIAGQYDDIGRFLTALENKFPAAEIRSLDVTIGQPETGVHAAVVELILLMRPEDKVEKPKAEKSLKAKPEKHT